jgi:hypothetical protein
VESKLGPLGTSATYWPIVPAPDDCENGEFSGRNGRGNRSTRRKPAPAPLCPPQIPLDQTRDWTRAAAVRSHRLTASAMARPTGYLGYWQSSELVFRRWWVRISVRIPAIVTFLWFSSAPSCKHGDTSASVSTPSRMSREEMSGFRDIMISVIHSHTCVLFRTVSQIQLFRCAVPKLWIIKRYYVLFLIPVCIVQVTKVVQFT